MFLFSFWHSDCSYHRELVIIALSVMAYVLPVLAESGGW